MEDKNITVLSDQPNDTHSPLAGSSMTKAGRLAMELSHEKKDLSKSWKNFRLSMMKLNLQLQRELQTGT